MVPPRQQYGERLTGWSAATMSIFILPFVWGQSVSMGSLSRRQVLVRTDEGRVAGYRTPGGVATFLGIPYAQPPVGSLRFRPPKVASAWQGLHDATSYRSDCMQSSIGNDGVIQSQSEDCLYLNVWTPTASRRKKLAVMVWIHGGAWQIGGSSREEYNGARLAANGVVVINFNYRLGAFGFLAVPEDGVSGNFGLMDQRVVLHWVQRNVRAFGGDPSRVTLFGESAGAKSISLHLLMAGSGDLFQNAILQSNPFAYQYRNLELASWIGEGLKNMLSCGDVSGDRGLRCLQELPAPEIVEAMDALHGVPRNVGDFFTWAPTLTMRSGIFQSGIFRFIPGRTEAWNVTVRQPLETMSEQDYSSNIPVLIGTNAHEGHIFVYTLSPLAMHKFAYWSFVAILFKTNAPRVLRTYAALAEQEAVKDPTTGKSIDYRPAMSIIINDYLFRCDGNRVQTANPVVSAALTSRARLVDKFTGAPRGVQLNIYPRRHQ